MDMHRLIYMLFISMLWYKWFLRKILFSLNDVATLKWWHAISGGTLIRQMTFFIKIDIKCPKLSHHCVSFATNFIILRYTINTIVAFYMKFNKIPENCCNEGAIKFIYEITKYSQCSSINLERITRCNWKSLVAKIKANNCCTQMHFKELLFVWCIKFNMSSDFHSREICFFWSLRWDKFLCLELFLVVINFWLSEGER